MRRELLGGWVGYLRVVIRPWWIGGWKLILCMGGTGGRILSLWVDGCEGIKSVGRCV